MSKTGAMPEKEGELKDFGGNQDGETGSTMEEHKGPYVHGNDDGPVKGRAWHGMKKPHKK